MLGVKGKEPCVCVCETEIPHTHRFLLRAVTRKHVLGGHTRGRTLHSVISFLSALFKMTREE